MSDANPYILVTGGAGYIGSHAVMALIDNRYNVVVLDDLSTGCSSLIPKDVPCIIGDHDGSQDNIGDDCL